MSIENARLVDALGVKASQYLFVMGQMETQTLLKPEHVADQCGVPFFLFAFFREPQQSNDCRHEKYQGESGQPPPPHAEMWFLGWRDNLS
ncbi:MAG: hypothetical protein KKC27_00025 [Gammaproteobacteria bacterium]|nr:hypothetical protein [Gammaproteobacteria bacterium]